jgi:V8-like Glu-specific endopeptidase
MRLASLTTVLFALATTATGVGCARETATTESGSATSIFGGHESAPGAWPSVVALATRGGDGEGSSLLCTGTLIGPRYVLTAGHCLEGLPASVDVVAVQGSGVEGGAFEGAAAIRARALVIHPRLRAHPLGNADHGLVELEANASADSALLAGSLEASVAALSTGRGTLVGFGRREDGGVGRKFEVETRVTPGNAAEATAGGDGEDACDGDSGGPVFASGGAPVFATISRGKGLDCGAGVTVSLAADASCWIGEATGWAIPKSVLGIDAAACAPAPRYTEGELGALEFRSLCDETQKDSPPTSPPNRAPNATQRETVARLMARLGAATCEDAATRLAAATSLDLSGLGLRDVSPLAGLTRLATLDVTGNRLTDAAVFLTLPALTTLRLKGNDVRDTAALDALRAKGVKVLGEGRQLWNHTATAFARACAAHANGGLDEPTRTTVAALLWTTTTDDCALANRRLLMLGTLRLAARELTDLSPLAGLPVRTLDLRDNPLDAATAAPVLAGLEELSTLDLRGVPAETVAALEAALAEAVAGGLRVLTD